MAATQDLPEAKVDFGFTPKLGEKEALERTIRVFLEIKY
jgi:hypothetical protein